MILNTIHPIYQSHGGTVKTQKVHSHWDLTSRNHESMGVGTKCCANPYVEI